jgi:hypothetical protein
MNQAGAKAKREWNGSRFGFAANHDRLCLPENRHGSGME